MGAVVSILCMVLGIWCCYQGVMSYFNMKSLEKEGTKTTAEIIEVIKEESFDAEMGSHYSYWPIYEFTDIYGVIRQHRPSSTTGLEQYEVGDVVNIAYDPDNLEEDILILNTKGKYKDLVGYTVSGIFSFLIGLGVLIENEFYKIFFNG